MSHLRCGFRRRCVDSTSWIVGMAALVSPLSVNNRCCFLSGEGVTRHLKTSSWTWTFQASWKILHILWWIFLCCWERWEYSRLTDMRFIRTSFPGWQVRRLPVSVGTTMLYCLSFIFCLYCRLKYLFVCQFDVIFFFLLCFHSKAIYWIFIFQSLEEIYIPYPHWLKGLTLRCWPYLSHLIRPISQALISRPSSGVPGLFLMNVGLIGVKVGFKATAGWSRKHKPGLI